MAFVYGERIRLRAAERADIPMFVRWFSDPEVTEYLLTNIPFGLAEEEIWFEAMIRGPKEEHVLVIEARMEGVESGWTPVGNTSFMDLDATNRSTEIGIVLGEKEFWNRGFGTDAMKTMLRHGFENLNLHRIWLRVFTPNLRAIRAYEKAGYVLEGTYREAQFLHGRYIDVNVMSVLKHEWDKTNPKEGKDK